MVHAAVEHMGADRLVDGEDAADGGSHASAVARERVDGVERDAGSVKLALDGGDAVVELVRSQVEGSELGGVMTDVCLEDGLGAFKDGDLGRGRAGGGVRMR